MPSAPDVAPSTQDVAHTLVLEFGRTLTVQEWATVMRYAKRVPYTKRLRVVDVARTPLQLRLTGSRW